MFLVDGLLESLSDGRVTLWGALPGLTVVSVRPPGQAFRSPKDSKGYLVLYPKKVLVLQCVSLF